MLRSESKSWSSFANWSFRSDRASPQIPSVEFQQVEGAKDRGRFAVMTANQLKDGKPVFVADDPFAVDHA
jgi:hypothetical protein